MSYYMSQKSHTDLCSPLILFFPPVQLVQDFESLWVTPGELQLRINIKPTCGAKL